MHVRKSVLVAAAVLAGATGLAFIALGWWVQDWHYISDWTDPTGWWGALVRAAGVLLFSTLGLKLALAVVLAVMGVVAWMRTRRSTTVPDLEALTSASETTNSGPPSIDPSK